MTKRPCKVKGETDDSSYGEASKAARATYWPEVIAVTSQWGTGLKPRADHHRRVRRSSVIRICGVGVTSPHITRQRRGK